MEKIELVFIGILVLLQVIVFLRTRKKIIKYSVFFPASFRDIEIKKFQVSKAILRDNSLFDKFLNNLNEESSLESVEEIDMQQVELLIATSAIRQSKSEFSEVLDSTNAYLCKNQGASADFNILQDICDRHLLKLDNEIGNLINVPLYIGLAGTFLGIIIGLWGIDFSTAVNGVGTSISPNSISQLLNGVIAAMVASLFGLAFTVWNTALNYKPAVYKNDTDKNQYYDFMQRELLPVLNTGVAGSLTSFKSVLSHFIQSFGDNIGDYKDTAHLLNDNLQKQQLVLVELNKMSLVKTATKIAEIFTGLNQSSEHLKTFTLYQKHLNDNIEKSDIVVQKLNVTIEEFKDFNSNLKAISEISLTALDLQKKFKESLEIHFPTIADHREVWRTQIDELNTDIRGVYKRLNEYFITSTEQISQFIGSNNDFSSGIMDIQNSMKIFVENSSIQKEEFELLRREMVGMRNDFRDVQIQSIETNKALIDVIKEFTIRVGKLEIYNNGNKN